VLEVWGSTAAVRYADGRVLVQPLSTAEDAALDAALSDLLGVLIGLSAGNMRLAFLLRSPEFPVDAVANLRRPVWVDVAPAAGVAARELAAAINNDLTDLRRLRRTVFDTTPPAAVPTAYGPRRPDVDAAAGRMRLADASFAGLVGVLHRLCGHELVLETARAGHRGVGGLVVATTTRLLFVSAGPVAFELPLAAVVKAEVGTAGAVSTLRVADGGEGLSFEDWGVDDLLRVATGLNYAVDVQRFDGAVLGGCPSAADLFAEWQTLLERRQLAMVDDAQFGQQASGILLAVPVR
jgi:hypothetical protein